MRRAQATLIATVLLAVAIVMISIVLYMAYVKTKSQILEQPVVETEEQALESLILVKNITIKHRKTTIELSHPAPTKILVLCYNSSSVKEFPIPPGVRTITIPCIGTRGYDIIIPTAEGHRVIHIIPAEVAIQENKLKLETYITSSTNYTKIIGLYKIFVKPVNRCCCRNVTVGKLYKNYTKLREISIVDYKLRKGIIVQEQLIAIPSMSITENSEILLNYSAEVTGHKIKCRLIAGKRHIRTILRGPYIANIIYNCSFTKPILYKNITIIICLGSTCIKLNKTIVPFIDLNNTQIWGDADLSNSNASFNGDHYEINIRVPLKYSNKESSHNRARIIVFNVSPLNISATSLVVGIVNTYSNNTGAIMNVCYKCCKHKSLEVQYSINLRVESCKTSNFNNCITKNALLVNITVSAAALSSHGTKDSHRNCCNVKYTLYPSIMPFAVVPLGPYRYVKYIELDYKVKVKKSSNHSGKNLKLLSVSVRDYLYDVVIVPLPVELSSR